MARTTTPTYTAPRYTTPTYTSPTRTTTPTYKAPTRTTTPSTPTPTTPTRPTTPTTPTRPTTPANPTNPTTPTNPTKPTTPIENDEEKELIDEITIKPIKAPTLPGSPGPGIFGLMLSLSDIEEMIPKLRQASTDLKDTWSKTLNTSLAKIENSWAGEDAKVYTDKVQALDPQVDKMCQAIDLLAQTYQKVLDKSRTTVTEVSQKISSISVN